MRTSTLITSYIQAVIFVALGIRCVIAWQRERDRRSAHLAWAAGLFGLSTAISAVTTTIWDQLAIPPETPPRLLSIISSLISFVAIYAFLLFLSDFIPFPRWAHGVIILVTITAIVFTAIERPDFRLNLQTGKLDPIRGVHNPIGFRGYLSALLIYFAVAFGVLALAFLIYGFRSAGLARFRMLSIGTGFFLFFVVIGLIPRLLFGGISPQTLTNVLNVVRYLALAAGPLLLVGFAPPGFIRQRFGEATAEAHTAH